MNYQTYAVAFDGAWQFVASCPNRTQAASKALAAFRAMGLELNLSVDDVEVRRVPPGQMLDLSRGSRELLEEIAEFAIDDPVWFQPTGYLARVPAVVDSVPFTHAGLPCVRLRDVPGDSGPESVPSAPLSTLKRRAP